MLAAGLGLLKRVIANQPKEEKPKRASGKRRVEKPSDSVPPTHVEPKISGLPNPFADMEGPARPAPYVVPGSPHPGAAWPASEQGATFDETGEIPRLGKDGYPVNQT
jgi:hypothetical protein